MNEKPVNIIFLKQAQEFIDRLDKKTLIKLFKAIRKTKERIYGPWFKKLQGSKGIYEFRIKDCNKYYRLFAFWDKQGETQTLIVCTHGLAKKSNKTPLNEIQNAERLMQDYFVNK